jgi:hypothetical protein
MQTKSHEGKKATFEAAKPTKKNKFFDVILPIINLCKQHKLAPPWQPQPITHKPKDIVQDKDSDRDSKADSDHREETLELERIGYDHRRQIRRRQQARKLFKQVMSEEFTPGADCDGISYDEEVERITKRMRRKQRRRRMREARRRFQAAAEQYSIQPGCFGPTRFRPTIDALQKRIATVVFQACNDPSSAYEGIRVPSKHLLFVPRSQYEQVFEGFNVLDGIFKRNTHQIKGYDGSEPEQRELSVSPHCQDLQSWLGFERINALVGNRGRSGVWNAVFHRCNTVTMVWQLVATWQPGPSGDGAVRLAITTINYDYTRGRIHTPAGLCLTKKATEWLREDIFPQYFSAAAQITGREFPRKALCPTHPCSGCHSCSSADDVRADGRIRTKLVAQDGSISYIHFDNDVDETADAEDRSNDADDECNDPDDESTVAAQSAAEAATSNSKKVLPNRPQQSNADNSKRSIQEESSPSSSSESSPSSSSESSPSSSSESSSSSNSDDDDQSSPPARKRQRKYDQLDQVRLKALHSFR